MGTNLPDVTGSETLELPSTAVPLGSMQGGVWRDDFCLRTPWGWTCQACGSWQPHFMTAEHAYVAMLNHQRRDCQIRRDGGQS